MIAFVKEAEALMEKGHLDRLKSEEGEKSLVHILTLYPNLFYDVANDVIKRT